MTQGPGASAQVEILLINVKDQKKKDKRYLNLDENGNQRTIGEKRSEGGETEHLARCCPAQVPIDEIKEKRQYEYWKRNNYKEKKSNTDLSDKRVRILEEMNGENSVIGSAVKEAETKKEILTIKNKDANIRLDILTKMGLDLKRLKIKCPDALNKKATLDIKSIDETSDDEDGMKYNGEMIMTRNNVVQLLVSMVIAVE
ncbi:hypothetical protein C2G38_2222204 [Gigaspora rosea]|uniref:Uncharacterized protein n=1 Tax=Gigaspora rosea TaxID=44941 RepID=A0A397U2P8_9GLOM|nr:hypothetical protein C2G38_2222204 [Gigaspora rosea]